MLNPRSKCVWVIGYLQVGSICKFCPQMACCSSGSYSQASHQRDSRSWVNRILGNKSGDINYSSTRLEHIGNGHKGINTSISISLVFESLPPVQKSHPLDLSLTMSPFQGCKNDYHKRRKTKPSEPSKHLTHQFLLLWSFRPAFMCCDAHGNTWPGEKIKNWHSTHWNTLLPSLWNFYFNAN